MECETNHPVTLLTWFFTGATWCLRAVPRHYRRASQFDPASPHCYDFSAGWSSLVARWAHNPKVGGSNPPPATKSFIELRASDVFTAGAKKGNKQASAVKCDNEAALASFHFASLASCLSAISTTLLLASRFDSIMALP